MAKRKTGYKTNEIPKPIVVCLMCEKEFTRKNPRDYTERVCRLCRGAKEGIERNYDLVMMGGGGRIRRKGGGYRGKEE